MKGTEKKLVKYMEGPSKRFVIPVYQRNYDWKIEHCKQLYDDLVKIIKGNRKSHFFGSLVSVYNSDSHDDEYQVIDGQQRLTTVSILFLAMYNLIDKGVVVPKDDTLKQRILEEYLIDKYQPAETRIKLKPVKNDQTAFGRLFQDPADYMHGSNLTVNYGYFYDRIQKQEITIDQLYDAIYRLEIIDIQLNQEDNPQMIFESLNSTGMDLSEGDKIRNYVLMGLPSKEQELYYNQYWNKIEICTNYSVSAFIRDYLSVKQQVIPSQRRVYFNFKEYVEQEGIETEPLLADMLAYARRYETLLKGNTDNKALNGCINRLNRLETNVTRPFFLEVLRLYDEQRLTMDQVAEAFLITEDFLFRRTICDLPTNALNKIFLMLHPEIIRYDKTDDQYIDKMKYALLSKKEKARFPDNEEFALAFEEKPIYLMNSKNKIYILERLENYGTLEDKDVYGHCDDGDYSIEHIMPQHLTPAWQKELGEDYEQIHKLWLHRIANLTLTAYNSKYSNSSFTEKRTMKNGFKDSGIRLNQWVADKDRWTLSELEGRSKYLVGRALEVWPELTTEFRPAEKQLDSYTLDDDMDMTGRQIARFTFQNTEQPTTNWADMFQKVVRILYAEDKTIITNLAMSDEDTGLRISMNPGAYSNPVEIGDGIYIATNTNTQTKLGALRRLFKLYDEDPMDLVFYLRDETDVTEEETVGRYELRKKYWAYALPIIQEKFDGENPFANIHPSKENWVSGHFNMSGCCVSCVANYGYARVEVYLGRASKQENKDHYDRLFAHKDEIETAVGTQLEWDRNNDCKSSKISARLNNVTIVNETDWLQMANFHGTLAKKFYDVIVPYLQ